LHSNTINGREDQKGFELGRGRVMVPAAVKDLHRIERDWPFVKDSVCFLQEGRLTLSTMGVYCQMMSEHVNRYISKAL
jgi:hypothetical protein